MLTGKVPDSKLATMCSNSKGGKRSATCGSLLFDCEVDDNFGQDCRSSERVPHVSAVIDRLTCLARPSNDFAQKLLLDVRSFKRAQLRDGASEVDAVVLALRLSLVGYNATVRKAIGGGAACFRNLRHEFISVRDDKGEAYIVDPSFREHFQIPHPTATYEAIVSRAPAEFVGTSSSLVPLVQCLSMEMAESFQEQGMALPPWRRAQAIMSKWLPVRSRDVCYSAEASSASDSEGASPEARRHDFSRISDLQMASLASQRCNSKSLLSGRLSARSTSSSGGLKSSAVSVQAPVHWSQPPSYRVKMAAMGTPR